MNSKFGVKTEKICFVEVASSQVVKLVVCQANLVSRKQLSGQISGVLVGFGVYLLS